MKKIFLSIALAIVLALSLVTASAGTITTLGGNEVYYEIVSYDFSEAEIESYRQYVYEEFGLEPVSPASPKYNCHSYAWYNSSCWISDPTGFITDPHTHLASGMPIGSVAVYGNNGGVTHSAVVSASSPLHGFQAYSKWGSYGVYYHAANQVPEVYKGDGAYIEFYTRDYTHDIIYVLPTGTHHTEKCTQCSYTVVRPHQFSYSNITETSHCTSCSICGHAFQAAHSFRYTDKSVALHTKTCSACRYQVQEIHTFEFGECVFCGRLAPSNTQLNNEVTNEE